jgi:hypothetical protein
LALFENVFNSFFNTLKSLRFFRGGGKLGYPAHPLALAALVEVLAEGSLTCFTPQGPALRYEGRQLVMKAVLRQGYNFRGGDG